MGNSSSHLSKFTLGSVHRKSPKPPPPTRKQKQFEKKLAKMLSEMKIILKEAQDQSNLLEGEASLLYGDGMQKALMFLIKNPECIGVWGDLRLPELLVELSRCELNLDGSMEDMSVIEGIEVEPEHIIPMCDITRSPPAMPALPITALQTKETKDMSVTEEVGDEPEHTVVPMSNTVQPTPTTPAPTATAPQNDEMEVVKVIEDIEVEPEHTVAPIYNAPWPIPTPPGPAYRVNLYSTIANGSLLQTFS